MPGTARVSFFGLPLDALSLDEMVCAVDELISAGARGEHACLASTTISRARVDREYFDALAAHRYVTADGQSVVWASRLLGHSVPERVSGADLMLGLLELASRRRYRVFLLGARADVLEDARAKVVERYPGARIVGSRDGYFSSDEESAIVSEIANAGADLLFLALPSPQKEYFVLRHRDQLGVAFVVGVGGMFDILGGRIKRAPVWIQRAGFEWAFRVAQEPRRLARRYFVGNTRFLLLIARPIVRYQLRERFPRVAAEAFRRR
jgi:N-acetylglucosaminyldiphosphoundecaprenol N-acetyl-beta-D-mannosaminyltransferase